MNEAPLKMLFVGGCRSGKSLFAEKWVSERFAQKKIFVATLQPQGDKEMEHRIALHQKSRGEGWQTMEGFSNIVHILHEYEAKTDVFLVDCLTIWLTNLMMAEMSDRAIEHHVHDLCKTIADLSTSVVLVANEVGLGIVPESSLGRRFRDLAGWTNQQVAQKCHDVIFMAAGLPIQLKGNILSESSGC